MVQLRIAPPVQLALRRRRRDERIAGRHRVGDRDPGGRTRPVVGHHHRPGDVSVTQGLRRRRARLRDREIDHGLDAGRSARLVDAVVGRGHVARVVDHTGLGAVAAGRPRRRRGDVHRERRAAWVVPAGTVTGPQVSFARRDRAVSRSNPHPAKRSTRTGPHSSAACPISVTPCASPVAVVVDGQREPDRLPDVHLRRIRRLHDVDRRRRHTGRSVESLSEPSFVVVTSPVLSTTPLPSGQTPPVAAVVGEVMCTVNVDAAWVVPPGTVTGPQVRTPAAIAQVEFQPAPCEAIDQDRPAFVGSVSVKDTPFASPSRRCTRST